MDSTLLWFMSTAITLVTFGIPATLLLLSSVDLVLHGKEIRHQVVGLNALALTVAVFILLSHTRIQEYAHWQWILLLYMYSTVGTCGYLAKKISRPSTKTKAILLSDRTADYIAIKGQLHSRNLSK